MFQPLNYRFLLFLDFNNCGSSDEPNLILPVLDIMEEMWNNYALERSELEADGFHCTYPEILI